MCDCQKKCNCSQTKLPPIDLTKPVQTVGGKAVRIIATDRKGEFPVVALVAMRSNVETLLLYNILGQCVGLTISDNNLVNIPERKERFLNLYANVAHTSVVSANDASSPARVGLLKVCFENDKPVSVELLDV